MKHFVYDKDRFLNYHRQIEADDFTNSYFKRIFNTLRDFYSENEIYTLSDVIQYVDSDEMKEAFIALDNFLLNDEPYDHELDDYVAIILENRDDESKESLNRRLNEALRLGDVELQKYYLEKIVNFNKNTKT